MSTSTTSSTITYTCPKDLRKFFTAHRLGTTNAGAESTDVAFSCPLGAEEVIWFYRSMRIVDNTINPHTNCSHLTGSRESPLCVLSSIITDVTNMSLMSAHPVRPRKGLIPSELWLPVSQAP